MECNKDEAVRSLLVAEKKFAIHDYAGAKKFVVKAQMLFPALEGATQMLAAVEVHNTAQGRALRGEHDWYSMLQVDPCADEATIRKQYRKLAFALHPDKNKFLGAESAFKLVGEAWTVLSDEAKRFAYNEKRGIKLRMNVNQTPLETNGLNNLRQTSSTAATATAASRPYSIATFWTACPYCKMQYQYFRTYENFHLLCQKCKRGYVARDINAMNGFPWSNSSGNFGPQFRPESLYTKFATSSKSGTSFPNGFFNGNVYSQSSSSATVSAATATVMATATAAPAPATVTTAATANPLTPGATTFSRSAGANAFAAEFVRQMYQKAQRERVQSQREEKQKEKEKEKQERDREKEERRKEKEAQKKLREDEKKREATLILLMRQKEMEERKVTRRKRADKSKTISRKNDTDEDDETDEDEVIEENNQDSDSQARTFSNMCDFTSEEVLKVEVRRSSRMKPNVSYRLDGSDDENVEASQFLKRPKFEIGAAFESGRHITEDGLIQQMLFMSGGVLFKSLAKADEIHKLELAGKFRSFLKEYVQGRCASEDNKVDRDLRSLKKCAFITNVGQRLHSGKKKASKVGKLGNSIERFQKKVNVGEQSPCPPSQAHDLGNEEEVALHKQADLDTFLPSSPKSGDTEASLNIIVPDSDFHNFDADRTESKLLVGQLWGVYDDKDGMPRLYCRIIRILSLAPFKVRVKWLDPDKTSEHHKEWVESSHLLTCGEFKFESSYDIFEHINVFSHMMLANVSQKGLIKIYPRKGEVWALYRDWTQDWFRQSRDECNYTYDMVEVATDFSQETGIYMVFLVKVQGFKTLFQQASPESLHCTSKEVFKFSHRVPAYRTCGTETANMPKGCWELDPASTPLELIHGLASEAKGAK